jgi:integrase
MCLNAIAKANGKVATARARTVLSTFFTWCMRQGIAESNPTIGTEAPKQPAARDRVLDDQELAAVWRACADDEFGKIVRLLILTGCRRQEIGGMRQSELDLDAVTWTLPKERAKNKRAHTLPLHGLALSIVKSIPMRIGRDHLFGDYSPEGFTAWYKPKLVLDRDSHVTDWDLHDIRRTVATGMANLGVLPHVVEAALNHVSGAKAGVAGIYNRSSYEREVRAALAAWEDQVRALITGEPARVVPFEKRA